MNMALGGILVLTILTDFPRLFAQITNSRTFYNPDSQIQSCFSSFAPNGEFISSSRLASQTDCMRFCYNNANCKSILWDQRTCFCIQFSQTAGQNPTILLNRSGTNYLEKTCGNNNVAPVTNAPQIKQACSSVIKTAYFLATGTEIIPTSSSITTTYPEENKCISACTEYNNVCWSLNLYPKTKTCIASFQTLPPDGTGVSKSNPDAIYLQKFCLPDQAPTSCREQFFFLFPQKNLFGNSMSTINTNTLAECAGNCAATIGCKAGVYDVNTKACVLKSENTLTSGTALNSSSSSVYYFENGCLLSKMLYKYRYDEEMRQNRKWSSNQFSRNSRMPTFNWIG